MMAMMNSEQTLSFAHGAGDLAHNSRRKNGNERTRGIRSRRAWNETLVELDVDDVLEREFGPALHEYNEAQIAKRHPERCKTLQGWVKAQRRGARPYTEYVVQLGNRLTGCAYEWVRDKEGNQLDKDGNVIYPWQTKKEPDAAVNQFGDFVPSRVQMELKPYYRDVVSQWSTWNPDMIIVGAYVHADERGGVHLHIDCVCKSKARNGIGLGLGVTGCISQMLDRQGIKYGSGRRDNAQKVWTNIMRQRLTSLAAEHGFTIIDGKAAGRKHRTVKRYIREENLRNAALDKLHASLQQKEQKLLAYERSLEHRNNVVTVREKDLEKRVRELQSASDAVNFHGQMAESQRLANVRREEWLDDREKEIDAKEMTVQNRLKALSRMESDIKENKMIADKVRSDYPEILSEIMVERGRSNGHERD